MRLQVKDGSHVASHETAEECALMMSKLLRKAQKAKEGHPIWCDQELIISHDNATFFTAAELPAGEGEVFHVLRVPSKSPDIHQIVEHPIHPIKAMFRKRFTQVKGVRSHERAMKLLEECIRDSVKVESIQANLRTYNDTLLSIIKNGGDWADIPLR